MLRCYKFPLLGADMCRFGPRHSFLPFSGEGASTAELAQLYQSRLHEYFMSSQVFRSSVYLGTKTPGLSFSGLACPSFFFFLPACVNVIAPLYEVDKMLAKQEKMQEDILETQNMVNQQAAQTRQQLADMEKRDANRTKEQTQQLVAKIDQAQKEQNARLAYMMQASQCNAELQTEKMKEFVGEQMAQLQDAVLSGTGAQIDAAVDKLTDAMNTNRYILEDLIKSSTASTHDLINERFGELNTRLDAMDESLDQVQDPSFSHD